MYAKIKAISYYLPEQILSNEDLSKEFPEWSIDKIAKKTGISERHIASQEMCSSDLAILAAKKLFQENNINPDDIDFLILCTQTPDYFLPTTACIVQHALGLSTKIGAFDINLGCSGYIYGLSIAKGLIESGICKNLLFITSETYSKLIHPNDKSVRTIFGDAAAATLVTLSENDRPQIHSFTLGTDGKGIESLIVKNGGMRNKTAIMTEDVIDEFGNVHNPNYLYMDGSGIFVFTLRVVPTAIKEILLKAQITIEDVDVFIFHQANQYMLSELKKKIGIPDEKFYIYLESCGNTVSSTIPIALYNMLKERSLPPKSKVLLMGFGVGLSWGGCIIEI